MIGKIGGKEYECLLDTGATKSIISPEVYLNHPNRNDLALRECRERLVSIDKSPVAVRGEVELEVDLCGTILVGHFMIAEIADDVVLGIGLQRAGGERSYGSVKNRERQDTEIRATEYVCICCAGW